jgi:alkylation response protein AidB-like acyl-CoA dehydrogenase
MTFYEQFDDRLSAEDLGLIERARSFCRADFRTRAHEAYLRDQPFDVDIVRQWAELGMLALQVDRSVGGHGASYLCKVRVAQEMAEHSFAAAFALNNMQGMATRLCRDGTAEQQGRFLERMMSGSVIAALAMTEPQGGSDLRKLATHVNRVEGGWLLNGTKSWVTNGTIVNCLMVLAHTATSSGGSDIAGYLVECEDGKGLTRSEIRVPGAQSFRLAEITFKDYFIPATAQLYGPGEAIKTSLEAINAARVHVAAMCVASLRSALGSAAQYCGSRVAFGKDVLQHQGLRWELAQVATQLEAASALVFKAAAAVNDRRDARDLAARAKAFAIPVAVRGIEECIRVMGAVGASSKHRLSMLHSEVRMAAFADGTQEMLLDRIGRTLNEPSDAKPNANVAADTRQS